LNCTCGAGLGGILTVDNEIYYEFNVPIRIEGGEIICRCEKCKKEIKI